MSKNPLIPLVAAFDDVESRLEAAGIRCMAVGGFSVAVWARPRYTKDVDVKALASRDEAERVIGALQGYSPLTKDPAESFRTVGFAFFKDSRDIRIDILLAETGFDQSAIDRRVAVEIEGSRPLRVCSAEDLIVYKLISTRPQDEVDARNVIVRQGDRLDHSYVTGWLRQFEEALADSTLVETYRRLSEKTR